MRSRSSACSCWNRWPCSRSSARADCGSPPPWPSPASVGGKQCAMPLLPRSNSPSLACGGRSGWGLSSSAHDSPSPACGGRSGWGLSSSAHGVATSLRFHYAFGRSRMTQQFFSRASRPTREFATAVRTPALQRPVRTVAAERAFEGADHCLCRVGRQIAIAAFAVGSELQHVHSLRPAHGDDCSDPAHS